MVAPSKTRKARVRWVLLAYRLPREPSTPRIAVWRSLKRLGVAQLLDGLVALPLSNHTRERLEWLAEEVSDAGGEATIWLAELGSSDEENALAASLRAQVASDYHALAAEAERSAREDAVGRQRRSLARLRRELRSIQARDYFPPPEREAAQQAVERLAAQIGTPVA